MINNFHQRYLSLDNGLGIVDNEGYNFYLTGYTSNGQEQHRPVNSANKTAF